MTATVLKKDCQSALTCKAYTQNGEVITFPVKDPAYFAAVIVTPELACFFLEQSKGLFINRHISPDRVDAYGSDMKHGRWELNGSTLAFNDEGIMVDGYTRCYSCFEHNAPFPTDIRCGLRPEAIPTIDTGRPRSLANVLAMDREHTSTVLAQALQWVYRYKTDRLYDRAGRGKSKMSHQDAKDFLEKNEGIRDSVMRTSKVRNKRLAPPGVLVACHYICGHQSKSKTAEFFEHLDTGADLASNSPIRVLRDKLMRRDLETRTAGCDAMMIILHCFLKWVAGSSLTSLRVPTEVPKIRGFKFEKSPKEKS